MEANRDIIVGIKIMATGGALGAQGLKPLERARKLGDVLKLPLLVHIGESWTKDTEPVHVGDVLKYLTATASSGRRCATRRHRVCSWTSAMVCTI